MNWLLSYTVLSLCACGITSSFVGSSVTFVGKPVPKTRQQRLSSWQPSTVLASTEPVSNVSRNANDSRNTKVGSRSVPSSSTNKSSSSRSRSSSSSPYSTSHARFIAAHAILEEQSKPPSQFPLRVLEKDINYRNLKDSRDRTFARLLVATVERRKGQLDKVLAHCNKNSKESTGRSKQDCWVRAALRIGAAQLLFLDTPSYAAVKETVDILRMDPNLRVPESKIKFVNAILRRLNREGKVLLHNLTSPLDNISPWLRDEWRESWGGEMLNSIVEAGMTESPIYISVKYPPGASESEKEFRLASICAVFDGDDANNLRNNNDIDDNTMKQSSTAGCEILPHGSICVPKEAFSGAISNWPLYTAGEWWVQDASAALPALALYNALSGKLDGLNSSDKGNGEGDLMRYVVDMCAAPGGKSAQLLSLGFDKVTAIEAVARRAGQLRSNLQRLQLEERCDVVVADGTQWVPSHDMGPAKGVLLDVPCTATGTASRRPDVFRRDGDLSSILDLQQRLAIHCADNVLAVGGFLVYATCSLLKQESEDQILKLISRQEGAVLKTVPFQHGEIPGFDDAIDSNGWLRVIPGLLPGNLKTCDGFFVARLQRVC